MIREVRPPEIEATLVEMWEALAKKNKMRACLFNLVVFHRAGPRTPYFQNVIKNVVEKFPCRVLFVTEEPSGSALKTSVSVLMPQGPDSAAGCEQIDVSAPASELERVPSVVRPHILPDLPVSLLWTEDPSKPHQLFEPLAKLAGRIIFDSECTQDLAAFAKSVATVHAQRKVDVADLNWARIAGWRDLLAFLFTGEERVQDLRSLEAVEIVYNARPTEFFCHLNVQSRYFETWLRTHTPFQASIRSEVWEKIGSGTILSVKLTTKQKRIFECARIRDRYHFVEVRVASPESCELPFEFMLGKTATGQSLVSEICMKGTSSHYLAMLQEFAR